MVHEYEVTIRVRARVEAPSEALAWQSIQRAVDIYPTEAAWGIALHARTTVAEIAWARPTRAVQKGTPMPHDPQGEPQSMAEYTDRYNAHTRLSGYGLDVTMHMPCPFCAAPDWLTYRVIEVEAAMTKGATCQACGRAAKGVFTHRFPGETSFEVVQTGGPDQPAWLEPKMRRAAD